MARITYPMWILSYYREAELRGANLLQRLLRKTEDPQLLINLTRHLADEARHAWLWTELIHELGGVPLAIHKGYQHHLRHQVGIPSRVLNLLALTHVVEERVQQRYCEHAARSGEDQRTVAVLQAVMRDEQWHLAWVKDWLTHQEQQEGCGRVTELLHRYRALEAEAYAALMSEEERLRRKFGRDSL
jgi:rubrerythrin